MPELSDFETLNLTGMELEEGASNGERITHDFGDGYGATVVTGSPGGLYTWTIQSGALPDADEYQNLIDGVPRFEYYLDFIKRHTIGGKRVFQIEFRGRQFHATFVDNGLSFNVLTYDLFSGNPVAIKQAKVSGIQYAIEDNAIFQIEDMSELFSWHVPNDYPGPFGAAWPNHLPANVNNPLALLGGDGDIAAGADIDPDPPIGYLSFNSTTGAGWLYGSEAPHIYEAFFLMRIRENTFTGGQGLLTNDVGVPLIYGENGDDVWHNSALAPNYEYRYNGTALAESNQTAPMNEFGVVHVRYIPGITLTNLQVGKRTNAGASFLKGDIAELLLFNAPLSENRIADVTRYLKGVGYLD